MYNDKIYLTAQEILEHEFKIDARGYRPQEVDKFLDMVIRDYTEYNNIIKDLEYKNKVLMEDNYTLKAELRKKNDELDSVASELQNEENKPTNIDLLRRISQLEKVVYGKKD